MTQIAKSARYSIRARKFTPRIAAATPASARPDTGIRGTESDGTTPATLPALHDHAVACATPQELPQRHERDEPAGLDRDRAEGRVRRDAADVDRDGRVRGGRERAPREDCHGPGREEPDR